MNDYEIAEEVLCLGYPPIAGFGLVLVAESGQLSSTLKTATGSVASSNSSYLDGESYILVSTRVRGGNSGGPVVNRKGHVVGMVASTSINAEDSARIEGLGYGLLTPKSSMLQLLRGPDNPNPAIIEHELRANADGWYSF